MYFYYFTKYFPIYTYYPYLYLCLSDNFIIQCLEFSPLKFLSPACFAYFLFLPFPLFGLYIFNFIFQFVKSFLIKLSCYLSIYCVLQFKHCMFMTNISTWFLFNEIFKWPAILAGAHFFLGVLASMSVTIMRWARHQTQENS